jgi:hypothetical protein
MKFVIYTITSILLFSSIVLSQTKDEFKPEVKVSGTIFTGWEFNIDNANFTAKLDSNKLNSNSAFGYDPTKNQFEISQNSFFLERAYLTILASLTPTLKGRITSDVYSLTDGNGKTQYQLGIKFAWLDWTPFKKESGLALDFVFGVIPNQWIPVNEKYYGYRGFAKTLTDYQWTASAVKSSTAPGGIYNVSRTTNSYFSPADLGINVTLTAPKNFGELYINILNGNGYRNLSFDNRFKDVEAIAFIHPLAEQINKKTDNAKKSGKDRFDGITDVTLGGFAYIGKMGLGENYTPGGVQYKRNRFGGMLHLRYNFKKFGFFKIGGEYSLQSNQDPSSSKPDSVAAITATGISGYLEFNPPIEQLNEKVMLVARYDMFDPNNGNDATSNIGFNNNTDKQTLFLLGLAYKPSKMVTLGASYQQVGYQLPFIVKYDGSTTKNDSRFLFHAILDF